MRDEVDKYMDHDWIEKKRDILDKIIKFEFPEIKNLNVHSRWDSFRVSFDEGKHTKEEVLGKINEYLKNCRNYKK